MDEGEAGGKLLLLELAGLAAEIPQAHPQQAGGELDSLGVAADPEQLLGDAARDLEGGRVPILDRARAFYLGFRHEIRGLVGDPNVLGEACVGGPELRCLRGFPDAGESAGQDDRTVAGIEGEGAPDDRPLADAAGFERGGLARGEVDLGDEIVGPLLDESGPLFPSGGREAGATDRQQRIAVEGGNEDVTVEPVEHAAAHARLAEPPGLHEGQLDFLAEPLATDTRQEGHQRRG